MYITSPFDDLAASPAAAQQTERKLPGLYPWLRFERCTREQWSDCYGVDLRTINLKAAHAYLKGEAIFFGKFEAEYASALGNQRAAVIKQLALEDVRSQFNHAAAMLCKSPIEQLLLAALIWAKFGYEHRAVEIWDSLSPKPSTDVVIAPQYQIEKYVADFAIFIHGVGQEEIKIVVECDGHEFHEKNKEQAARDKRRNREIEISGWYLLKFTGSEIWQDHRRCAADVSKLALMQLQIQLRRRGLPVAASSSSYNGSRTGL